VSDSKLDNIIRKFLLLSEDASSQPSVKSRFLALEELLSKVEGKNLTEFRRLEVVKEQFRTIKKEVKKLEERNLVLETENKELQEKLVLLEESKAKLDEMSQMATGAVEIAPTKPANTTKKNKKVIRVKENAK